MYVRITYCSFETFQTLSEGPDTPQIFRYSLRNFSSRLSELEFRPVIVKNFDDFPREGPKLIL